MPGRGQHNIPQDHETVILRGRGTGIDKQKHRNGETETKQRFDTTKSNQNRKLEEATDVVKPLRINPKIKDMICKMRNAKNIKQKELANHCQVNVQIIQQYENGKAKAEVGILKKMEAKLGCKLTGKDFGKINI
jgi:ribosome-binding protein aMBF1 (putative translation factor)